MSLIDSEAFSWEPVDAALDLVEEGDTEGLVLVFLAHRNRPLAPREPGEHWGRVTVSSFSKHVGIPRHTFNKWLSIEKQRRKRETA